MEDSTDNGEAVIVGQVLEKAKDLVEDAIDFINDE